MFFLRQDNKDTLKNDAENIKKNVFIPEGSSVFIEKQDEKEISVGFLGGCSALFPNMWLRKSLSIS